MVNRGQPNKTTTAETPAKKEQQPIEIMKAATQKEKPGRQPRKIENTEMPEKNQGEQSNEIAKPELPAGRRGQSNELLMLVVSVIMAVLILHILIGILNNVGGKAGG